MAIRKLLVGQRRWQFCMIAVAAAIALGGVKLAADYQRQQGLDFYLAEAQSDFIKVKDRADSQLMLIYQNIRTLAALPGVRKIDRHANNIDADTLSTFQQIYNNLASSVAVSEVYIVPESIDPDQIDPATGKPEEPILMFDSLIVNGGSATKSARIAAGQPKQQPEIEIHEYRHYKEQFSWFRKHVPLAAMIDGLKVPVVSSPETITCDNTIYNQTLVEQDRKGMVFAVPFYGEDGKLRGSVVAIILSRELAAMLPAKDYSLVHTGYNFVSPLSAAGQERASLKWVRKAEADPGLLFSRVDTLSLPDGLGQWKIWSGRGNADFWNQPSVKTIGVNQTIAMALIAILAFTSLVVSWLLDRNRRLNQEMLVQNFETLGKITAKISHEIRNPLSSVRNSIFLMRKIAASDEGIQRQAERAERGIVRCDQLIADLLEYTRRDELDRQQTNLCEFLTQLFSGGSFAGESDITVVLPQHDVFADVDAARLGKAIVNIVDNAASAIATSGVGDSIILTLKDDGRNALIEVNDDGPGIEPGILQSVFEPLFTTKNFAAGLGLPTARDIVERHGGTVALASIKGQGAHFTISLPGSKAMFEKIAA